MGFYFRTVFLMLPIIHIIRFFEVYSIISVSVPLYHINTMCLQNLTLGLTSCLLDNVILYYFFYQCFSSEWLLFPWILYTKSLCRETFIIPQIIHFSLSILFAKILPLCIWILHSYGYLSVFSLFYNGLTILSLVHLKSCIYMGNCSSPLNTAPAFGACWGVISYLGILRFENRRSSAKWSSVPDWADTLSG